MATTEQLLIRPEEIHNRYLQLQKSVATREETIHTPTGDRYGIASVLEDCVCDWKNGKKSLRTVSVLNAYEYTNYAPIETETIDAMVALDAMVNMLDDTIDTPSPSRDEKIKQTANVAFASTLLHDSIPSHVHETVTRQLYEYFTALFQIPYVESQLLEQLERAPTSHQKVNIAAQIYRYRGRVIDAFVQLPSLIYDSSTQHDEPPEQLVDDLHTFRARRLLFKDIGDIERDHRDEDTTPILHQLERTTSPDQVATFVEDVLAQFEYSTESHQSYRPMLRSIENEPPSIRNQLSAQLDRISL